MLADIPESILTYLRDHIEMLQTQPPQWNAFYEDLPVDERAHMTKLLWSCDIYPEEEGLTRIPMGFARGLDVTHVTIPSGIVSIGYEAFMECAQLKSVSLPSTLERISGWAFGDCINLTEVEYRGTREQWFHIIMLPEWKDGTPFTRVTCADGEVVYEKGRELRL